MSLWFWRGCEQCGGPIGRFASAPCPFSSPTCFIQQVVNHISIKKTVTPCPYSSRRRFKAVRCPSPPPPFPFKPHLERLNRRLLTVSPTPTARAATRPTDPLLEQPDADDFPCFTKSDFKRLAGPGLAGVSDAREPELVCWHVAVDEGADCWGGRSGWGGD